MKASLPILLFAAVFGSAAALQAQVLSDDFTTVNTTTTWNSVIASGSGSITTTSGILSEKIGTVSTPYRTYLESQSTAFNPFAQALSFNFTGLTLSGTPGTGAGIAFYSIVGLAATDTSTNYWPGASVGGDYLLLELAETTSGYQLVVMDYGGSTTHTTATYTLAGAPTGMDWTIDGTGTNRNYSLTLTGTTFSSSGLSTASGTFSNFNLAGLGTTPASRLAFGAVNLSAASAVASVSLDKIEVDAVPEPRSVVLLLLGAGALLWTLRRRTPGAVRA